MKKNCDVCGLKTKTRRVKKMGKRLDACPKCSFHFYMERTPKAGYILYDFYNRPVEVLPEGQRR